jgi:hypothetical protein
MRWRASGDKWTSAGSQPGRTSWHSRQTANNLIMEPAQREAEEWNREKPNKGKAMLKPKEIAEISLLLWYLPLEKVEEIKKLALQMKDQCGYDEPVDDSDEWTEEDMRDAADASMRYAEETAPYDWDESEAAGDDKSGGEDRDA